MKQQIRWYLSDHDFTNGSVLFLLVCAFLIGVSLIGLAWVMTPTPQAMVISFQVSGAEVEVPQPEIITHTYQIGEAAKAPPTTMMWETIPLDSPPIQVGTYVRVESPGVEGKGAILSWQDRILAGTISHVMQMPTSVSVWWDWQKHEGTRGDPQIGDQFTVVGWRGNYSWDGPSDGLAHYLHLREAVEWSLDDLKIMEVQRQFSADLEGQNLALIDWDPESDPQDIRIDGEPPILGRWGNTYKVKSQGSLLTWTRGYDGQARQVEIRPGDYFNLWQDTSQKFNSLWLYDAADELTYLRPQWQPAPVDLPDRLRLKGVYANNDPGWHGTMRRHGFWENYGIEIPDWIVWRDLGSGRSMPPLPPYRWKSEDAVVLPGSKLFKPSLSRQYGLADWGPHAVLTRSGGRLSDEIHLGFDEVVVFRPAGIVYKLYDPQQAGARVCRVRRSGWEKVTLQCAEWLQSLASQDPSE